MFLITPLWNKCNNSVSFSAGIVLVVLAVIMSLAYAQSVATDKFSLSSPVSFPVDILYFPGSTKHTWITYIGFISTRLLRGLYPP